MEEFSQENSQSTLSAGEQKIREYVERIKGGEKKELIMRGLPQSFVKSIEEQLTEKEPEKPEKTGEKINQQEEIIGFLKDILPQEEPVSLTDFYTKFNEKFPLDFNFSQLAQKVDSLGIRIKIGSEGGERVGGHFDYQTGVVEIFPESFSFFQGKLTPDIFAYRIIGHELVHGIINSQFPIWDKNLGAEPEVRKEFNLGLRPLVKSLESSRGRVNNRVNLMIEIILSAESYPEELITYTLTDSDFGEFMRKSGQYKNLQKFLIENGLGDLEKLLAK